VKIVCFSINPVFPDRITGGASKHLMRLAADLAGKGHTVVLLAAEAAGGQEAFSLGKNIQVKPVLPFHLPFPQPYLVPPGDLARICELIDAELRAADRFYVHDGELLLPFLYSAIPTISSFRDNFYPESVLGSFISQADAIIAVSKFSADTLKASAGRVLPALADRIHIVPNGIDQEVFYPTDPGPIYARFGLDPLEQIIILHPHRPEPGKGLFETIQVVDALIKDYGYRNIKVLVPQWLEAMNGDAESSFHDRVLSELDKLGLASNFIFHNWINQADMAAYYSAGQLTLCLGNLVEAFGNVAYESLFCGTPAITARVGVHRSQLPDELICKVDYGDIQAAAAAAARIIQGSFRVEGQCLKKIQEFFSLSRQLDAYEQIICKAEKKTSPEAMPLRVGEDTTFSLAPWCYASAKGVFQDYQAQYYQLPALQKVLELTEKITPEVRERFGLSKETILTWYHLGLLVPVRN